MLGSPWSGALFGAIAGFAIALTPDDAPNPKTKDQP
jgi:hypothetical protein